MAVKGKKGKAAAKKAEAAAPPAPEPVVEEVPAAPAVEEEPVEAVADEPAEAPKAEPEPETSVIEEVKEPEAAPKEKKEEESQDDDDDSDLEENASDEKDGDDIPDKESISSIFVGNAPLKVKEDAIRERFEVYGPIKKITILQENRTGRRQRKSRATMLTSSIIYVDYESEEDAKKACAENQKMFDEKRLRVNMARERPKTEQKLTLFVGNLSFAANEEELYDLFSGFGEIDFVRIVPGKGYGFVHFKEEASVDKSVEKNKTEFCGREIHVEKSRPPAEDKEKKARIASAKRKRTSFYNRGGGGTGGSFSTRTNTKFSQYKRPRIKF